MSFLGWYIHPGMHTHTSWCSKALFALRVGGRLSFPTMNQQHCGLWSVPHYVSRQLDWGHYFPHWISAPCSTFFLVLPYWSVQVLWQAGLMKTGRVRVPLFTFHFVHSFELIGKHDPQVPDEKINRLTPWESKWEGNTWDEALLALCRDKPLLLHLPIS